MTNPSSEKYIVAGTKRWNRRIFDEVIRHYPGEWFYISRPDDLTMDAVRNINPRYIFFPHWSWLVQEELIDSCECVCFHMTDLPYGRGGSPLQNLIIRGHKETKLTALRMVKQLDAGPVYYKEYLSLEGSAEEIYIRAAHLSAKMIRRFIMENPKPGAQKGKPTVFKRRKPRESEIPDLNSLDSLFDFIRMLDAEAYPKAYLKYLGFRYEFNYAVLLDGRIEANVRIVKEEGQEK